MSSHRLAYEIAFGPIPDGLSVLHSCDNPACCNPAHLRAGTTADNAQDREARGRGNPARGDAHPARRDPIGWAAHFRGTP